MNPDPTPAGYTRLSPSLETVCHSPWTGSACPATDWHVPGMWVMLEARCPDTGRVFLTDVPYGLPLLGAATIDVAVRQVLPGDAPEWYRTHTEREFRNQSEGRIELAVTRRRIARRIVLINACGPYFGDCASLILRIAPLKDCGLDVVVLAPANVSNLIPDWVAETWEIPGPAGVDLSARWHGSLAREIKRLVAGAEACYVPHLFQPAAMPRTAMAEFTRVPAFDRARWTTQPYTVGFLWRSNRLFPPERTLPAQWARRMRRLGLGGLAGVAEKWLERRALARHISYIQAFDRRLRRLLPSARTRIIGVGRGGRFGPPIRDLWAGQFSTEADRRTMQSASECHVLVSAHGSQLVPFSGLPGALVQMFPDNKWLNFNDAGVLTDSDPGEAVVVQRSLSSSTPVGALVAVVHSLLVGYPLYHLAYHRRYAGPLALERIAEMRRQFK